MAGEKEFPLSIIIRTVDRATAGIKKIHEGIESNLEKIRAPVHRLGTSFEHLGHAAGLPHLVEHFKHVGHAAHEVWEKVGELKEKFLEFAIGIGIGALEVEHLIHQFADLAKTAKLVGLSADQLAQFRFAAAQSGVSTEEFDNALEKLNKNLGDMKAGGGKLKGFLQTVSPLLLKQVQHAKSNTEAFDLMAAAMAKITDPTKRAALATAAFGKGGQPLINLLAKGPEGIKKLREEYEELAGSQDEAAETAEEVHHAMGRVSAAADGIKAAIVVGLGPSMEHLAEQLKEFLVGHREQVAAFIKDFGEKLPGRIHAVVGAFMTAIGIITPIWNAIGGLKGAAIALAVILGGKLLLAVASLTVALLTNPFALIVAGIGLLIAAGIAIVSNWDYVKGFFLECWEVIRESFSNFFADVWALLKAFTPIGLIVDNWQPISDFFKGLWDGITATFEAAWKGIKTIVDKVVWAVDKVKGAASAVADFLGLGDEEVNAIPGVARVNFGGGTRPSLGVTAPGGGAGSAPAETRIKVDFANAPKGMRVATDPRSSGDVDTSVGYQMALP